MALAEGCPGGIVKRTLSTFTLIIVLLSSALACASYRGDLRKYTKSAKMFELRNFEAILIWNATFFSEKFRKSFEEKHIKIHHLEPAEAIQYRAEQRYEQSNEWEFFVGFYTQSDFKKFSNEYDSFWKMYLSTESGEKVKPLSVEMMPVTPYEKKMFPYLDRWSKGYRVTFPKVNLGDRFELTLHSIEGKSTLKWRNK